MPKIKVQKQVSSDPSETFKKVRTLLDEDKDLRKLDPGYQCTFDENSLSGSAKGQQFQAQLSVAEVSGGTSVEIVVELPFHLGLVKGMIQKTLEGKLEKALA